MKRVTWPKSPRSYAWIVDGHNAIFAHPRLESLQTGGKKAEARRLLEELFERFRAAFGVDVVIVYDGRMIRSRAGERRSGRVRVVYSRPPEEADDRILSMATRIARSGKKVAVVTSDRALGERLASDMVRVDPQEVDRRLLKKGRGQVRAAPAGDFRDIEEFFLTHDRPRAGENRPSDPHRKARERPKD